MTKIQIEHLRNFAHALLDHVEETHGSTLEFRQDYFWAIGSEEKYEVEALPRELTIGQLSECVANLTSMVEDGTELNYGLVWLAELLYAAGAQVAEA